LEGGSEPITICNGFSTNSETILAPKTGTNASTLAMRIGNTRNALNRNVSGINEESVDSVQSHTSFIRSVDVIVESGGGRASRMSWSGKEWWEVSFLRCGRRWKSVSWGVARNMWPSTCQFGVGRRWETGYD